LDFLRKDDSGIFTFFENSSNNKPKTKFVGEKKEKKKIV
jgi:hypothetical protein